MSLSSETLIKALVAAHRAPENAISHALAPDIYAHSMAVQAGVMGGLGETVAGWKVAVRPDGVAVAAPLFAGLVTTGSSLAISPHGLMGLEVEIGLKLARDLPRRAKPYHRDEVMAAVATVFIGIEIVSTRLQDHGHAPFPLVLADNMANGAYAIGEGVTEWGQLDLGTLLTTINVDGARVHSMRGGRDG